MSDETDYEAAVTKLTEALSAWLDEHWTIVAQALPLECLEEVGRASYVESWVLALGVNSFEEGSSVMLFNLTPDHQSRFTTVGILSEAQLLEGMRYENG